MAFDAPTIHYVQSVRAEVTTINKGEAREFSCLHIAFIQAGSGSEHVMDVFFEKGVSAALVERIAKGINGAAQ